MTKEQIYEGIVEQSAQWGMPFRDLLQEIPDNEQVLTKLHSFVQHSAIAHFRQSGGKMDVQQLMASCSVASFRLGLLIGVLLDAPQVTEIPTANNRLGSVDDPCYQCLQTGHVCLHCNQSKYDCSCSVGEYNDTICPNCNGRGVVER